MKLTPVQHAALRALAAAAIPVTGRDLARALGIARLPATVAAIALVRHNLAAKDGTGKPATYTISDAGRKALAGRP